MVGRIVRQPDGRLRADFRLWDVLSGQQMSGQQFFTAPDNWRQVAHIIADAIYERLTGEKGYFDSRIVFVDETGPKDKRVKRLAIMDQDGANVRYLTKGTDLVLTPRFNPTAQEITYMSYGQGQPQIYLFNIETGQRETVGNFPNMTFAPRFSPDGQKVIMSLQDGGNANIFTLDLSSRKTTRLTDATALDTSPSYSPDGSQIVFESDRGGTQQLYVMNADGSNPHRITFGPGTYSTPVWSPKGDLIAFTRQNNNLFGIGVIKPDGSGLRILTEGFPQRGSDVGAQWARDHVLPRHVRRERRPAAVDDRSLRVPTRTGSRRRPSRPIRPGPLCSTDTSKTDRRGRSPHPSRRWPRGRGAAVLGLSAREDRSGALVRATFCLPRR